MFFRVTILSYAWCFVYCLHCASSRVPKVQSPESTLSGKNPMNERAGHGAGSSPRLHSTGDEACISRVGLTELQLSPNKTSSLSLQRTVARAQVYPSSKRYCKVIHVPPRRRGSLSTSPSIPSSPSGSTSTSASQPSGSSLTRPASSRGLSSSCPGPGPPIPAP